MRKWLTIAGAVSILHFGEDLVLVCLGRFTDFDIWMLLGGTLVFGWMIASLSRLSRVKQFLGT